MALGYHVECYVNITSLTPLTKLRSRGTVITKETEILLSLDGKPPVKGAYREAWLKVSEDLWPDGLLLVSHTRETIDKAIVKAGLDDLSFFSYLLNKCKCIRVKE